MENPAVGVERGGIGADMVRADDPLELSVLPHVGRLAERMALTWKSKNAKDAVKIETDLQQVIPRESWTYFLELWSEARRGEQAWRRKRQQGRARSALN